jgi:hypothetical protein
MSRHPPGVVGVLVLGMVALTMSQRIEDLRFITPDVAIAHVRSELSGDERAPGQTFNAATLP